MSSSLANQRSLPDIARNCTEGGGYGGGNYGGGGHSERNLTSSKATFRPSTLRNKPHRKHFKCRWASLRYVSYLDQQLLRNQTPPVRAQRVTRKSRANGSAHERLMGDWSPVGVFTRWLVVKRATHVVDMATWAETVRKARLVVKGATHVVDMGIWAETVRNGRSATTYKKTLVYQYAVGFAILKFSYPCCFQS